MSWIIGHQKELSFAAYVLLEFWIGRTQLLSAGSVLELILQMLKIMSKT